jgi:hypothetical protein
MPAVTDLSTLENIAKLRGNIGHEFVLFVQSMIAAGLTAKMAKNVQKYVVVGHLVEAILILCLVVNDQP